MTVRPVKSGFIGDRAVVLGGSVAGLLAARVLSEAYEQVTVVERDRLPFGHESRRGVPQGRHIHGLIARGQQVLEELFPGFTVEMVSQGVPTVDLSGDVRWYLGGHRLRQLPSGLVVLSASRPVLEGQIRARVRMLENVAFLDECDVLGLTTPPTSTQRVNGDRVCRHADGSAEEVLAADLVVDATGRGSRTPVWLEGLGYRRPVEDRVAVGVGYTTCRYRLRQGALGNDLAILTAPSPQHPRGGGLAMIENGACVLTMAGMLGDFPPTDPAGLVAFARSIHHPDYSEALRGAKPLEDPVAFRFPVSVRPRYEKLSRFPQGLLVLGDALCSFNPVYGQGMSIAALEALTLRHELERGGEPDPHRFFRAAARDIAAPWGIAVGGDLAFPGVEGHRTPATRLMNAYIARLSAAAAQDAAVGLAFHRVAGLTAPPGTLLRIDIALRILHHSLTHRNGQAKAN